MSFEDELREVQEDLGISGYEVSGYEVGANPSIPRLPSGRKPQRLSMGQRNIRVQQPFTEGREHVGFLQCTANLGLAAAAIGNLVFTPNKRCFIIDIILDTYVAAAAAAAHAPGAIHVTQITVQGEPMLPGAGFIPLRVFYHDSVNREDIFLRFPEVDASQNVIVTLQNNDAATAHNVTGALKVRYAK